jgi:CelD/BcsL family acetyltransferase involved in cellulose biosynthesis
MLSSWTKLYDNLKQRHGIRGIAAFSNASFAAQLEVPGAVLFKAVVDETIVGIVWMYHVGNLVYYHLGAYNEIGYATNASFALFWRAIEHFQNLGASLMSLGAGAGATSSSGGLDRFKRGWATGARTVFLCGRIFDQARYADLMAGSIGTSYFPAYRAGEFV